jgi:hypothetical protein
MESLLAASLFDIALNPLLFVFIENARAFLPS